MIKNSKKIYFKINNFFQQNLLNIFFSSKFLNKIKLISNIYELNN